MAKLKGNRIRERRHALGIKQEDLASAAKVSVSSVNRFERNKGEPRASTLREILNCRMEDFF
ncbi:MAG: helix-turn-helix transcriptional regulator [Nitrospirae bacterium]|nr:helix-turn-helix transcriptional regulator [Nitrospirota bacterium]